MTRDWPAAIRHGGLLDGRDLAVRPHLAARSAGAGDRAGLRAARRVRPGPAAGGIPRCRGRPGSAGLPPGGVRALPATRASARGGGRSAQAIHQLLRARGGKVGLTTVYPHPACSQRDRRAGCDHRRERRDAVPAMRRRSPLSPRLPALPARCRDHQPGPETVDFTGRRRVRLRDIEHELEITGTCPDCARRQPAASGEEPAGTLSQHPGGEASRCSSSAQPYSASGSPRTPATAARPPQGIVSVTAQPGI